MKLSDLKPCASCEGPLLVKGVGIWYVVRVSHAMLSPYNANQVLGLTRMLGGSTALAEALAPRADEAAVILGDKDPAFLTELHICFDCFHSKPLGAILEKVNAKAQEVIG